MKKLTISVVAVAALFIGVSVSFAIHRAVQAETEAFDPTATGDTVFTHISVTDEYWKWDLWPGTKKYSTGDSSHGESYIIRVNEVAKASIKKGGSMTDGAMIVMENFSRNKILSDITVMYKKGGFNPAAGDWFWAKYGPTGNTMEEGRIASCVSCHAKGKDYVIAPVVK